MKSLIISTLLLGTTIVNEAATLSFPEVPAAKEQASQKDIPCLIVWYGSDWQPQINKFCKTWEAVAKEHADSFVFGQFDDKTGLNTDVRKKNTPHRALQHTSRCNACTRWHVYGRVQR